MSSKKRAHNKGERDGAKGKPYKQPNSFFDELIWGDRAHDENAAYRKGFRKGKKDRKK